MPNSFLSRPEYSTRVRLPKWNVQPCATTPANYQDRAKVLRKTCTGWTRADHIRRSRVLMRMVDFLEREWHRIQADLLVRFGQQPFGHDWRHDDRLTREEKDTMRMVAHTLGWARDLATAHDYVVSRLSKHLAA